MSQWRISLLLALSIFPILGFAGYGAFAVFEHGWMFYAWWPLAACWSTGLILAWYWQRKNKLIPMPEAAPSLAWTERDHQAWKHVEARAKEAVNVAPEKLTDPQYYVAVAEELALELARVYYPGADDPWTHLTIVEILSVVELASHDMGERVQRYLPAGHLFTVRNWLQARRATEIYAKASNVYWLISALFNPAKTSLRFAASKLGLGKPLEMLQQNLLVWFHILYLHRMGNYLIEVYSGRLRVGIDRYRELVEAHLEKPEDDGITKAVVTLTLLGQVKAGKSSLINALLGEQKAKTDVLPATAGIDKYDLHPQNVSSRLVIQDTVGYGHEGPSADQVEQTCTAAQASDVLLFVLHARNPARQADVEMLAKVDAWFAGRPNLKRPPILAVLTHIDLLTPAMEWSPPYDWQNPAKLKEQQISQAVSVVRDTFAPRPAGCVPICAAQGRVYGVEEWLLPAVVNLVSEGQGVALVRTLHSEADIGKVRRIFDQFLAIGGVLTKGLWTNLKRGSEGNS